MNRRDLFKSLAAAAALAVAKWSPLAVLRQPRLAAARPVASRGFFMGSLDTVMNHVDRLGRQVGKDSLPVVHSSAVEIPGQGQRWIVTDSVTEEEHEEVAAVVVRELGPMRDKALCVRSYSGIIEFWESEFVA